MQIVLFGICFSISYYSGFCQDYHSTSLAVSQGLSGNRTTIEDPLLNPAFTLEKKCMELTVGLSNHHSIGDFNSFIASVSYHGIPGTLTFGFYKHGIPGLSSSDISFSAGRSFSERLSAGVAINLSLTSIHNDDRSLFSVGYALGILFIVNEQWSLGTVALNPFLPAITGKISFNRTSSCHLGLSFKPFAGVQMVLEASKQAFLPLAVNLGVEAAVNGSFFIRFAAGSRFSFGLGFCLQKIKIDLAASYHRYLGFSPSLTLKYRPWQQFP